MEINQPRNLGQNLLNREESSHKIPKPVIILIVIEALTVGAAVFFGFVYHGYVEKNFSLSSVLYALGIYSTFGAFSTLLEKEMYRRAGLLFLEILGMLIFFLSWPLSTLLLLGLAVYLIMLLGISGSRTELKERLRFRFFNAVKPQFSKTMTALALMAIVLYLPKWSAKEALVSESSLSKIIMPAVQAVNSIYPEYGLNGTSSISSIAGNIARSKFESGGVFSAIPKEEREKAVQETTNQFLSMLTDKLGVEVKGSYSLPKLFYETINVKLGSWRERLGSSFMVLWAVVMFFLVRSIGVFVSLVATFASFLIYHILLALHVLHLRGENEFREVMELA